MPLRCKLGWFLSAVYTLSCPTAFTASEPLGVWEKAEAKTKHSRMV